MGRPLKIGDVVKLTRSAARAAGTDERTTATVVDATQVTAGVNPPLAKMRVWDRQCLELVRKGAKQ